MYKEQNIEKTNRKYDLEERTLNFASHVRSFIAGFVKTMVNMDDCKQLLRSSGSVGANYIEANESLSKKDFVMRIKICRKEAKETQYWLRLLSLGTRQESEMQRQILLQEATELTKIFGAIVEKSK